MPLQQYSVIPHGRGYNFMTTASLTHMLLGMGILTVLSSLVPHFIVTVLPCYTCPLAGITSASRLIAEVTVHLYNRPVMK